MARPTSSILNVAPIIFGAVAACGAPPERALARPERALARPTEPAVAADAGPAPAAVASSADGGRDDAPRVKVGPCTDGDQKARATELGAISAALRNDKVDTRALLADLRATLAKPCLAHLAPTMTLPRVTSVEALRQLWEGSLHSVLLDASEGLRSGRGQHYLAIPPSLLPELPDAARRELATMICAPGDSTCDRSGSYITRAHEAFDAMARIEAASQHVGREGSVSLFVEVPQAMCTRDVDGEPAPTTFEAWASCAASQAPKNRRYAEPRLRAPDRGWLFLRGRRGHYQFADEVRAYDLATGAAYVARNEGGLVLGGHDFASQRGIGTTTGQVAPDQVRELAFVLLTRKAVVKVRTEVAYAAVPAGIPLSNAALSGSTSGATIWGEPSWGTSAQTQIAWTYIDLARASRVSGDFTWPNSSDWVEEHINGLVRIAEAGLVKGCAPAKLPAPAPAAPGRVSSIDVDPAQHQALNKELEARLESLRPRACAGAK